MKPIYRSNKANDWHQADIVAALCKAGWSLRRLSIQHGYHPSVLAIALRRPYLAAELLIAETLGVSAATIWPSRYPQPAGRHDATA
ncbi:MAG: helix-turn-helix domain-containing protein [Candidatus Competibacteraceae bacterium]|nr:helix-turn-helix domain-containing protein [Candidatus Competibacteraceae bacterium]